MFTHYPLAHFRSLPPGLIIAALLTAAPAFAATWTWTGLAGNNSWNNSGNWNPVVQPPNNGTADVSFGGTRRLTPDLTLPWNVNAVNFLSGAGAFNLFSTLGNTLTVGAGGITNFGGGTQTISHAITLSAPQTWTGTLNIIGAVNNGGNLLTINSTGSVSVTIYGVLSGSGGLIKNGSGNLSLQTTVSGLPNTYAGTTTVNAGLVVLNNYSGVVAIPGALDIGDGVGTAIDTVENFDSQQIADSATVSVFSTGFWDMSSIFSISETITNLNIVSTGIAGGGLVTIGNGTLTILGSMTMTGGTVTSGTGALVLNGNLTTTATGIAASINGNLDLGNGARTFTIADGAALNDLNVTSVVSNGGIIKDGPGTLRLGAANTYAGGTTLNAGTILIGNDAALGSAAVTINADGILRYTASATVGRSIILDGGVLEATSGFSLTTAGALQGQGTAVGNVANSGSVVPEGSTGLLHVEGNYTQSSSGRLSIFADLFLPPGDNPRLDVTGDVALDGTLQMNLGGMGQFRGTRSFDILDWTGSLSGTFSTLQLPMFGGAFTWDTSQLYTNGVLILTGPPLEGDFNFDGIVDAADYVVWRKTDGSPAGYNLWRANFGQSASGGSGANMNTAVPEPATLLLLLMGMLAMCSRNRATVS